MAEEIKPKTYFEQRFEAAKTDRTAYEPEWRDINDYIVPRRGRFSSTEKNRPKKNRKIYDGTATYSARTLASGLMAGITSPARPWFKLATPDPDMMKFNSVKVWLELVEEQIMHVLAKSNFYNVLPNLYTELGCFGNGSLLVYEDREDVVRFFSPTIGEYYFGTDDREAVCDFMREKRMSVAAAARRFGVDKLSTAARNLYNRGQLNEEITVRHSIEPNDLYRPGMIGFRGKPIRSVWWEEGAEGDEFLLKSGFRSKPFMGVRWNVVGNDTYGYGCGADVIGDVISLQSMTKKKARAVDKQIDPPMNAPGTMKDQAGGFSNDPGSINFVDGMGTNVGFQSAQNVQPNLAHFAQDIQEIQNRIKHGMYEDLFLMLVQMDRAQITATEIVERKAEKLIALGPVVERMNDELLEPVIDRVYDIIENSSVSEGNRLLPPPPPELNNVPLKVEFLSIFRQAQQQEDVTRTVGYVQNLALMAQATGDLSVMDNLDADQAAQILGNKGGVPAQIITSDEKKKQIREARAQQQAAVAQQQQAMQAVEAAKALGNTPLTQEQNVLSRMMGV